MRTLHCYYTNPRVKEAPKANTFKMIIHHPTQYVPDYYGIAYPVETTDHPKNTPLSYVLGGDCCKGEGDRFPDFRNDWIVSSACYPIPLNLLVALYIWFRQKLKSPWT